MGKEFYAKGSNIQLGPGVCLARVPRNGRNFEILKFRSMTVDAEKGGRALWATTNDARVTRVGAFIRKTRLDELPQLPMKK